MQNEFILTPDFWDCECESNFIHRKTESFCKVCQRLAEEQPDSRVNEVKKILESEYNEIIYQIDVVDCFGLYEIGQLLRISEEVEKLNNL
jgi:superfamily II helicase